ncbi:MAG: hypothetical protein CTY20_00630 [Hyphomicrobium sp.]|nr:MAG: hypothetical protein CTY20_00630 [Hyphomicrobium sp.]
MENPHVTPELIEAVEAAVRRAVGDALAKAASPPASRFLSSKEVREYLGISEATLYAHMAAGRLKAFKIGSHNRFKLEDVDALLVEVSPEPPKLYGVAATGKAAKRARAA